MKLSNRRKKRFKKRKAPNQTLKLIQMRLLMENKKLKRQNLNNLILNIATRVDALRSFPSWHMNLATGCTGMHTKAWLSRYPRYMLSSLLLAIP